MLLLALLAAAVRGTLVPDPASQTSYDATQMLQEVKHRFRVAASGSPRGPLSGPPEDALITAEPIPVAASSPRSAVLTLKEAWERGPLTLSEMQRLFEGRGLAKEACRVGELMGLVAGKATLLDEVVAFEVNADEERLAVRWLGDTLGARVSPSLGRSSPLPYYLWKLPASLLAWLKRVVRTGPEARLLLLDELLEVPSLAVCTLRGLVKSTVSFEAEAARVRHPSAELVRQVSELLSWLGVNVERTPEANHMVARGRIPAFTVALLGGEWFSEAPLAPLSGEPAPLFDSILLHWVALRCARLHDVLREAEPPAVLFSTANSPSVAPSPSLKPVHIPPMRKEPIMTAYEIPFLALDDVSAYESSWVDVGGVKVRTKVSVTFVSQGVRQRSVSLEVSKEGMLWGIIRARAEFYHARKTGEQRSVALMHSMHHFDGDLLFFDSTNGVWFPDEGRWIPEPEITINVDDAQYHAILGADGVLAGRVVFEVSEDALQEPAHIEFVAPSPETRYVLPWENVNGLSVCVIVDQRNSLGHRWMGVRINRQHTPPVQGFLWWGIDFYERADAELKKPAVKWQFGDDMETTVTPVNSSVGGYVRKADSHWYDMGLTFHRTLYNEYSQALGPREELAGRIVLRFARDETNSRGWMPIVVLATDATRPYTSLWIPQMGGMRLRADLDCSLQDRCFIGVQMDLCTKEESVRRGTFAMQVQVSKAASVHEKPVWRHEFGADMDPAVSEFPLQSDKGVLVAPDTWWMHPGVGLPKASFPPYVEALGAGNQILATVWYKITWESAQK